MSTRSFGKYVRRRRLALLEKDRSYSLRRVALASGLEPSFLSKIERGLTPPPSEARIKSLAQVLGEDGDLLLALAGKVSSDLQEVIRKRPQLFADLIRELKDAPDGGVSRMVREARARYGVRK
jgi:transcriptional regulator with XRE-family HTH domain